MTIKAITYQPVPVYEAPAYPGQKGYGFRISNLDLANPVYFDTNLSSPTPQQSSPLPQQASVTFDGSRDVWMTSGVPGLTVLVDFSPSSITFDNPVGVQLALSATGVPPAVPGMASYTEIAGSAAGSPYTLTTFAANSRIWAAELSLVITTSSTYASATNGLNSYIKTGSGIVLAVAELAVSEAGQVAAVAPSNQFYGIEVLAGDTIELLVNSGISIPNAIIRASAVVLASTP